LAEERKIQSGDARHTPQMPSFDARRVARPEQDVKGVTPQPLPASTPVEDSGRATQPVRHFFHNGKQEASPQRGALLG
jgi:hypothetical protein